MRSCLHFGVHRRIARAHPIFLFFLLLFTSTAFAQVSPTVPATTHQHNKQVIGYITQWDAWKNVSGIVAEGGYNQLNVDYSQYTILNFSFFGIADDGSLHSGDYRNPNIYQASAVQNPAPMVDSDIYSSWDMYILNGELTTEYYISDGDDAYVLGFRNSGSGWTNINTGASGSFPLSVHKSGGALGLIALAHQQGVKAIASIGGWSMCRYYPDMAADPTKRARFLANIQQLMAMGFDGIDLDWEYPNAPGMNILDYSTADYTNFATLVESIRSTIGTGKLITACFSPAAAKIQGFDWARLNNSMDYFNFMTYDYNGGWSTKAGHNAPLYDYPGEEFSNFSLDATVKAVRTLAVNMNKVIVGAPFYGRGVITTSAAALNGSTTMRSETIQPDGPITTCADFTNWPTTVWAGTPNYSAILQATASGWTDHWDSIAQVPYMTNGNYFLSYDNPRSIAAKAQYVKDNNLAGVIVWNVFGDMLNMTTGNVAKSKLIYCPNTTEPLVNTINQVFASGSSSSGNKAPVVSLTAPSNSATFTAPASITLTASASDSDGTIAKVAFYNGGTLLTTLTSSPYMYSWTNVAAGTYNLTAVATDNSGTSRTSSIITITVNASGGTDTTGTGGNTGGNTGSGNCSAIATWSATQVYTGGMQAVFNNNLYTANYWTQGNEPDLNSGTAGSGQPWILTAACSAPSNKAPTVSLTAPSNSATFTAPASISITASAADADGTVASVTFYNGATLLGTATSSPYTYSWTNVAAGTYTLTAIATDNAGAKTTSAAVSITVNGSGGSIGSGNCAGVPTYQPYPAVYNIGDEVVYNGNLYQSTANGLYNVTPGTADWWWTPLGACTSSSAVTINSKGATATTGANAIVLPLTVFPNPASTSQVQLQIGSNTAEQLSIDLVPITGNSSVLHLQTAAAGQGTQLIPVDLSRIPKGIYIVKVNHGANGKMETTKIIKL